MFDGKSVAIIGNAQSIHDHDFGAEIDQYDLIIRMNKGGVVAPERQGSKTHIVAIATNIEHEVAEIFGASSTSGHILWLMSADKVEYNAPSLFSAYFVYPLAVKARLFRLLGSRPSSGAMIAYFVTKYTRAATIGMYGFDFFKTPNLYSPKHAGKTVPHDFNAEEAFFAELENSSGGRMRMFGNDGPADSARAVSKRKGEMWS